MRLQSLRTQPPRSLLVIAGNEIGDLLYEVLISAAECLSTPEVLMGSSNTRPFMDRRTICAGSGR